MRTLSIDFASHDGHLACVDGSRVAALKVFARVNDAEMIPLLESVLKDAGWKKESIERVACNLGPGGFTSVRGGAAFANALASQLNIPLGGYHGSALSLERTHADWWFHSTKTDALFARGGSWAEPVLISLAELPAQVTTVCGDLLDAHKMALLDRGAMIAVPKPSEAVLPAFLAGLEYSTKGLVPWYGRGI